MCITINKVTYECLKFKKGDCNDLKIEVSGLLKTKSNHINIEYGEFEGYGYKLLPHYESNSDSTAFLVYIYQPGDPELRESLKHVY